MLGQAETDEGESDNEVLGGHAHSFRKAAGDMPPPPAAVGTDVTPEVFDSVTKNMSQRYDLCLVLLISYDSTPK